MYYYYVVVDGYYGARWLIVCRVYFIIFGKQ